MRPVPGTHAADLGRRGATCQCISGSLPGNPQL